MKTVTQNKPESAIKVRLLQHLIDKWKIDKQAILVNEMPILFGRTRVDLALFSNRAYGFEIKSQSDSLTRLTKQISIYRELFDKTIIVADKSHMDGILEKIDDEIGLWVIDDRKIIIKKRGKLRPTNQRKNYIDFMSQDCMKTFYKKYNFSNFDIDHSEFSALIANYNSSTHREHLYDWYKKYYFKSSQRFWDKYSGSVNFRCLEYLSPLYVEKMWDSKRKSDELNFLCEWKQQFDYIIDDVHMWSWLQLKENDSSKLFGQVPDQIQNLFAC